MAETAAASTETPKVVAKSGTPVASPFPYPKSVESGGEGTETNGVEKTKPAATPAAKIDTSIDNKDDKNNGGQTNSSTGKNDDGKNNPPAEPTDDQLRAWFQKQGIEFKDADDLKTKLAAPVTKTELTPEQKEQVETQKRKRIVDEHLSRKGTVEQLAAFEKIISIDKKVLGLDKEVNELIAEGLSKEKAEEMAKRRYSQYTDEEIAAIEDATEKAEMTKEREIGLKKLERKGSYLQKTAKDYLDILEKDIAEQDADTALKEQHASKVEAAVKKYERKMTLEMGQVDEQKIAPIDFEVSETALASAKELIGDRSKFTEQLLTKDGHVNFDFILPHLVKSFSMDEAVKKSYLVAQDRTIDVWKSKFGTDKPTLGANGKQNGTPGKIAGYGQPKVGRPEYKTN